MVNELSGMGGAGDPVSYNGGSGNFTIGNCTIDYPWPWYDYWYPRYYPVYTPEKSKVEQAFKIVGVLMEKKIIETMSVKKFVELVNEISKVL